MRAGETGLVCERCGDEAVSCEAVELGCLQALCWRCGAERREVGRKINQILRCEKQGMGRLDRSSHPAQGVHSCDYDHSQEEEYPFLNVLCDGSVVKL